MKNVIIFLIAIVILQGCVVNREAVIKQNKKACEEYGFVKGTELYGECIFKLIERGKERRRIMAEALSEAGQGFKNIKNNRIKNNGINCTSTSFGGTTRTNCY